MRVAILAKTRFQFDNRVRKEALSLRQAGFDVVRVGVMYADTDPVREEDDAGPIVRAVTVRTASPTGMPAVDARSRRRGWSGVRGAVRLLQRAALRFGGPFDDLRHYAGRVHENNAVFAAARALVPDVVIACDLDTLPAGSRLKRELGTRLIYDYHELFVDQYAEWSGFRRWLYRRLERRLIGTADLVMTVGPAIARSHATSYRVAMPLVVMNGPSEATATPEPVHSPVRILFQGAFTENRGLLPLVEHIGELRGAAELYLQGFGSQEQQLRETVERLGIDDVVRFVEPCAPQDVIQSARAYDVGIVPYRLDTPNLAVATPNKVLDYLGAGLALAVTDAPGIREPIPVERCGVSFDARDPAAIMAALSDLVSDPVRLTRFKAAAAELGAHLQWDAQFAPVVEWIQADAGGG